MAQQESNHSSKDRTILWIILPCTIAVSLLFTNLNHNVAAVGEKMPSDFSIAIAKKPETKTDTLHKEHSEQSHTDTLAAGAHH